MFTDEEKHITSISLFSDSDYTFKTSLEVIQKVMNVPMCALTSLLRANGYNSDVDTSSFCIDEKELEIFTDAYVRKMRSYFFSSLRNISTLSPKELSNFNKFINLFKKKGLATDSCKWSDIDIDHLREIFRKQIQENTPQQESSLPFLAKKVALALLERVVVKCTKKELKEDYLSSPLKLERQEDTVSSSFSLNGYVNFLHKIAVTNCFFETNHADTILKDITRKRDTALKEQIELLHTISQDGYCPIAKRFRKTVVTLVSLIENIFTSARYYLYPNDSDNDPNNTILHYVI